MKVALRWLFTAALAAPIPAQRVHLHPSGAFFTTSATNERRPEEVALVSFGAGEITPSMLAEFGGAVTFDNFVGVINQRGAADDAKVNPMLATH